MSRCEDYPCCGHEVTGCPVKDAQGRIVCEECGKYPTVRFGLCYKCASKYQRRMKRFEYDGTGQDEECSEY